MAGLELPWEEMALRVVVYRTITTLLAALPAQIPEGSAAHATFVAHTFQTTLEDVRSAHHRHLHVPPSALLSPGAVPLPAGSWVL